MLSLAWLCVCQGPCFNAVDRFKQNLQYKYNQPTDLNDD